MPDDLMPEDLRDFILGYINSIVQLEALPPAKRLYTSEREVADVLARLCADGLLICSYGIRLAKARAHEAERGA